MKLRESRSDSSWTQLEFVNLHCPHYTVKMHARVNTLIAFYQLTPLPVEGTLFASTYRSSENLPNGEPLATGMIGLYAEEPLSHSTFHRLQADELWHFYEGDALRLILLHPDGRSEDVLLGPDESAGHHRQFLIPALTWQAGGLLPGGEYALFGCTMSPGFTSRTFEGGRLAGLLALYPSREADLRRFTVAGETQMPEGFAT